MSLAETISTHWGADFSAVYPVIDEKNDILYLVGGYGNVSMLNLNTLAIIETVDVSDGTFFYGVLNPLNGLLYIADITPV